MDKRSNVIPFHRREPGGLNKLNIPVPPTFEESICYPGEERYVALWWTRSGEDVVYDDGLTSGTGYSYAWLAFARHKKVAPALSGLDYMDFDRSDGPAKERLLLDRYQRSIMVGPAELVMVSVREGNNLVANDGPVLELTHEQLEEINNAFNRITSVSSQVLQKRMEDHQKKIGSMISWLDEYQEKR